MYAKITPDEINTLSKFIRERSGIVLEQDKAYLYEGRLGPLLQDLKCPDYKSLYDMVKRDFSGKLAGQLIDAVCTNETSFFRDKSPFQLIVQKIAPDFYERSSNGTFSMWSAASSTGQEVYSVIMTLSDAAIMPPRFRMRFIASDISDKAIAKASRGIYTKFELARGMEGPKLHKYFNQRGDDWSVKDEVRAMVQFKKANLLDPLTTVGFGKFDLIMCRNVAIYFSADDKRKLFNCLANMLNPGGVLMIGSTETLMGVTDRFMRKDFRGMIYYDKV